jgi:hypothetical protein
VVRFRTTRHMRAAWLTAIMLGPLVPAFAADDPFAGLNLETHGFVSFGYLKSWGNNWHGETLDGTDEFWEAAGNVIARPMDHLRLGAQLFVRDLGEYGNGQVELDWAYADWRQCDEIGIQVGRVKIPSMLFSESIDVDAGRASVFLPRAMYPTRAREILLSTDGAKCYGSFSQLDWALYGGQRQLQTDGDFASYLAYFFRLSDVSHIESDFLTGGQVRWHTPVEGLTANVAGVWLSGLELTGLSELAPVRIDLSIENWYGVTAGLLYESSAFTLAAEYLRYYAPRITSSTPVGGGPVTVVEDTYRPDSAYVSCTWHARPWLDCYAALEGCWDDPTDRHGSPYTQAVVAAFSLHPTDHWTVKAEYRFCHGTNDIDARLNPDGIKMDWQVLALKTTVDF